MEHKFKSVQEMHWLWQLWQTKSIFE